MGVRVERQHNFLRISSTIYDLLIKTLYHTTLKTNSGSFVAFKTDYVKNLPWKKMITGIYPNCDSKRCNKYY